MFARGNASHPSFNEQEIAMRIAHLCLSNWYIEGLFYQENELIAQHVQDGHEVLVVGSTEVIGSKQTIEYAEPKAFVGPEGARVIRLPYRFWPHKLARKLRIHPGVYRILEEFRPEAILFHGTCGWEVATAARYVRNNPNVLFYIDSHEDWNNSAMNFLSREVLHKLYYRYCLSRAWPVARKILCVNKDAMEFVPEVYGVPRETIEFYPLGGRPISDDEYAQRRATARAALGVEDDQILFVQTGKLTRHKQLLEALKIFSSTVSSRARFKIAGNIMDEIKSEAKALIAADPRIEYLGWKSPAELTDILCAADVYVQPNTQSVTMQHSLCCHCAVMLQDTPAHHVYIDGNGWLVSDEPTMRQSFSAACATDLKIMQERSIAFARRMLDYRVLAKRVLRPDA
jgi:1,2-diacylglycerol 3-alpha-glucosyltransferase